MNHTTKKAKIVEKIRLSAKKNFKIKTVTQFPSERDKLHNEFSLDIARAYFLYRYKDEVYKFFKNPYEEDLKYCTVMHYKNPEPSDGITRHVIFTPEGHFISHRFCQDFFDKQKEIVQYLRNIKSRFMKKCGGEYSLDSYMYYINSTRKDQNFYDYSNAESYDSPPDIV